MIKMLGYFIPKKPIRNKDYYEDFLKFIEEDMMKCWNSNMYKLSYIITEHNLNLIMSFDKTVTIERIMDDFRKHKYVKEVVESSGQIVLFPRI